MSDRLAVFNAGRIEQVGTPAEVYEHPANEFVAGFVGVSNVVERDGRRFTIRPEKVRLLGARARPPTGLHVEAGTVARRGLRRAWSRAIVVALDAGGELQVVRQNLETSSARTPRSCAGDGCGSPGARSRRSPSRKCSPARRRKDHDQARNVGGERSRARRCSPRPGAAAATAAASSGGGGGAKADAGFKVPKVPMAQSVGAGEGKLNIIAWAGYAEDGSTDPKVDWVTPFEKQTGCQVNVKIGNTSDEMVHADAHRPVRRRLGLGRRDAAADRRRRRRAGQHRPRPQLRRRLRAASRTSRTTRSNGVRCTASRTAAGANLLMWNPNDRDAGARLVERGVRPSSPVQGQGHRLRLPDLHRRRGAVPEEDQARPQDHEPVRARRQTQFDAAVDLLKTQQRATSASTGRTTPKEQPAFAQRRLGHRHDAGRSSPTCSTPTRSRSRRRCPRRARPAGRTPG